MLDFELIGAKAIEDRLDGMREKIETMKHGDIFAEMGRWERQDMHRRHTYAKHRRTGAAVIVRPHSWYETKGRARFARKLRRKGRYIGRWSTRPILRPELLEQLCERMAELAAEKLKW